MFKRSLLSLILVSVIPLLALSIWYYFDTVNSLNEKSHSIVVQKNQMDQQILRLVMAEQIANVHDWSNQSIIRVSLSINRPEALVSILEALKQNHLLFESLQVFSADGKPFAGNFDAGVGLKRISASIQTLRDNPVRQTVFAFDGKIVIAEQISDKLDTVLGVLVGTIDISKLSSFLTLNGERIGGNFESTRSYFESNGKPVSLTNAETRDFAGKGGFTSCSPFLDMIGHLQVCSQQDRNESKSAIKRVTGAFLVSAVFSLILLIVIINLVSRWVNSPFLDIISHISKVTDKSVVGQLSKNDRIEDLHTAIKTLIDEVVSSREEMVKASKREASIAMSRSVAHDIRSPLAALNVLAKISTDLPEDQRHILQNATERITDIANNLLESHRDTSNVDELKPELLSGLIETVISEKRLQFSSQKNVSIQFSLDSISFGIFSKIRKSEFKRVISNLIDNAVESLEGSGTVTVEIFRGGGKNQIVIKDTGVGIPAHVLTKLGKEEVTFGKSSNTSGHGLGVLNAVKTIRSWGGELDFNSHPSGRGTEAFITLPDVVAPDWFLNELNLSRTTDVVVLDDERSIHSIWGSRLDKRTNIRHAYSPDEFSQMVEASSAGTTFLCDFELLGHKQTGADLIRKLGIEDRSILVTSRFEDDNVVEDCLDLKIKLLPKNLVSVVPIIQ